MERVTFLWNALFHYHMTTKHVSFYSITIIHSIPPSIPSYQTLPNTVRLVVRSRDVCVWGGGGGGGGGVLVSNL
ncbi:hypothetical protein Hanom_Chr07g00679951 [Helianthus anomalus]